MKSNRKGAKTEKVTPIGSKTKINTLKKEEKKDPLKSKRDSKKVSEKPS